MNPIAIIVCLSVIFQMISAILALRMLKFPGRRNAVLIILTAISLMSFRRVISLYHLTVGNTPKIDVLAEIIALILSILLLIGILYVARLIKTHEMTAASLLKSQEVLETIIETAPVCVKLIAADGTLQRMNRAGLAMIEAESLEEVRGKSVYPLVSEEHRSAFKTLTEEVFKGRSAELEFSMIGLRGRPLWLHTRAVPLRNEKGEIISQLAITADVTGRREAAVALQENERRLRKAQEIAHVGDWEWEITSGSVHWSDELYRIYGFNPGEIAPDYDLVVDAMHPDSRDAFLIAIDAALRGVRPFEMDYTFFRKDGSEAVLHTIGQIVHDGAGNPERMVGIVQDITQHKHAEEKMKAALWEKDILLKEIHHRVKNNLQIIASMLRLQSRQIRDVEARILFEESRNRVQAMSLIHERLYRTENLACISFKEYVDELVENIFSLPPGNASLLQKHIAVEEIVLDVNYAIPCGLIINELVSNSLRHAFPDGRKGAVEIKMHRDKKGTMALSIKDNGIGFPGGADLVNTKTLGLQLVLSLVKQLNGTIELDRSEGSEIRIAFNT